MKAPTFRLLLTAAGGLALVALLCAPQLIAEPTPPTEAIDAAASEKAAEAQAAEAAPPAAGLRVEIDPETGQAVVPPPSKRRQMVMTPEMQNALSRSSEGLNQVILPDGTAFVRLQGRFQNLLFLSVDEDGTVAVDHALPDSLTESPEGDDLGDHDIEAEAEVSHE